MIFYLPVFAITNENWRATFPKYEKWLISTARYPIYSETSESIKIEPNYLAQTVTSPSALDFIEMYSLVFLSTLSLYYRNQSDTIALENSWKILHCLKYLNLQQNSSNQSDRLGGVCINQSKLGSDGDISELNENIILKMKTLIEKRDESVIAAVNYKNYINSLKPSHYYWALYHLMIMYPDVVHKSHLTQMDTLITGLLTQELLGENGCNIMELMMHYYV
jgi:hypothetical protein